MLDFRWAFGPIELQLTLIHDRLGLDGPWKLFWAIDVMIGPYWVICPIIVLDFDPRHIIEGKTFGPSWRDLDIGFWDLLLGCVIILIRVICIFIQCEILDW